MADVEIDEYALTSALACAYRAAYRLLGDREDALDIAQEALARALVRWPRVKHILEPWVTRVATNAAIGQLRRRKNTVVLESATAFVFQDAVCTRIDLVDALTTLSRRQREVVTLRYIADIRQDDVASVLGISSGSVKRYSSEGLARLRVALVSQIEE